MNPRTKKWLQISLFNLLLIASFGVLMRYKIAWALPWVDQKNILHAHSHFAFAGWVTQTLMIFLVNYLFTRGDTTAFARYRTLFIANLVTAYGMLVTFPFVGYTPLSTGFSTLSIFVSYWFAIKYWRDLNRLKQPGMVHQWFKAALFFNVISSLGPFFLAYMLASKNISPNSYLASVYYFLHFQYNGWFFFSCMGLLARQLIKRGITEIAIKRVYMLFVSACIPAYFLSALWLPIPGIIYLLVVVAVFLQLAGWILTLRAIRYVMPVISKEIAPFARALFGLSAIAVTIKLILQAGSVIPSLSRFAFGFRPIIIGYLHLVLLGVITLFMLAYMIAFRLLPFNKITRAGLVVFTAGIIANEGLLMVQGISDMNYEAIPFINPLLFGAGLTLLTGMIIVNLGQRFWRHDPAWQAGVDP